MNQPTTDTQDLTGFHWIVINTSGGKDSQALLDVVVEQARAQGVEDRLVAVHCDLGRVEWDGTLELAKEQVAHYGLRFEVVSRPQGDLLEQVEARGMWPSSTTRFCTSDHKRDQVAKLYTRLAKEAREAGLVEKGEAVRILSAMGFRAQESAARAKRPVFAVDKRATGKGTTKQVWDWNPILAWLEEDVWARIRQAGTRHHRAYDLGMPRLSCAFCIFAPKPALVIAGRENPALLDAYADLEERIGHQFRGKPGSKGGVSLSELRQEIRAGQAIGGEGEDIVWGAQ